MTVVSARGLVKALGGGRAARRVLDGADLDVAAGEVVAVLGRSGSGKSTLLHVLGGLDRPAAGAGPGGGGGGHGGGRAGHGRVRAGPLGAAAPPCGLRVPVLSPAAGAVRRGQRA